MTNRNDVSATLIALERAALDRWGKGDPSGYLEISAPDVTYFDPFLDRRIDGLDALAAHCEPLRGKIRIDRYEIINPKVQVWGEVAVLTYNLESQVDDTRMPWNCTEVYRHDPQGWRIIQAHWSVTRHLS